MADAKDTHQAPALSASVAAFMKNVGALPPEALPVSTRLGKAERQKEEELKQERESTPPPGQVMEDGSIFVGQWQPKGLGQTFNVFAAKEDLSLAAHRNYADAVEFINSIKEWNGHNGEAYETDTALAAALKDGSYNGGWGLPPRELLDGVNANGKKTQDNNLYALRDTGGFAGTFNTNAGIGWGSESSKAWYTSCSEMPPDPGYSIVNFATGNKAWHTNNLSPFNSRLVRFEPVRKGGPQ